MHIKQNLKFFQNKMVSPFLQIMVFPQPIPQLLFLNCYLLLFHSCAYNNLAEVTIIQNQSTTACQASD